MEKSLGVPSRGSSAMAYERKFRSKWLMDPRFSSWLSRSPSNANKAFCIVCERELAGSVTFLERHKKTEKHVTLMRMRNHPQGTRRKALSSPISSEKLSEWKIASYIWREGLSLSRVTSLSSLLTSLSPSTPSSMTPARALRLLASLGQHQGDTLLGSTLKRTHFSLIFLKNHAILRYVDPLSKDIQTAHFPWRDEELLKRVPWSNIIATVNAPPLALDLMLKVNGQQHFLRLDSLEKEIEEMTAVALGALPQECITCSWEIAKFISMKKTDHFKEFRDLILRKGFSARQNVLKGDHGISLEEIVEFITSNWSSVMFWLASLELMGESSASLQGLSDNSTMELYFAFLNYILPCLSRMKSEFLSEDFRLHQLKASLQNTIRSILQNFMEGNNTSLEKASCKMPSDTYLNLNDVYRGTMTHEILKKRDPTHVDLEDFYFKTFNFYIHLEKGLLEHFSSNSPWWRCLDHFEALDPNNALRRHPSSIIPLASRFPYLCPHSTYEKLNQEWRELSIYKDDDRLRSNEGPMDFWKKVSGEKVGSSPRFSHLSNLALSLMTIAHSSMPCEPYLKEARDIESEESIPDASTLHLLFAKDYLRTTDASWEPPLVLLQSELSSSS